LSFDREQLQKLIDHEDGDALQLYLQAHSNLPGPRGNLELAADTANLLAASDLDWAMDLIDGWSRLGELRAGGNAPEVMLPFTAAQTAGALWSRADHDRRMLLEELLHRGANDSRWRVREGVAMGMQRIGFSCFDDLRDLTNRWSAQATLLEWRAIVAALAEPPLLIDRSRAELGIDRSCLALEALLSQPVNQRASGDARALRAALGYAISVFLAVDPDGFAEFERIARIPDKDAQWIVRENLKKARIAKRYPDECAHVSGMLNG